MERSKKSSFLEAALNTGTGYLISFIVFMVVMPLYGFQAAATTSAQIVFIFTATSLIRSYLWSRFFNYCTMHSHIVKRFFRYKRDKEKERADIRNVIASLSARTEKLRFELMLLEDDDPKRANFDWTGTIPIEPATIDHEAVDTVLGVGKLTDILDRYNNKNNGMSLDFLDLLKSTIDKDREKNINTDILNFAMAKMLSDLRYEFSKSDSAEWKDDAEDEEKDIETSLANQKTLMMRNIFVENGIGFKEYNIDVYIPFYVQHLLISEKNAKMAASFMSVLLNVKLKQKVATHMFNDTIDKMLYIKVIKRILKDLTLYNEVLTIKVFKYLLIKQQEKEKKIMKISCSFSTIHGITSIKQRCTISYIPIAEAAKRALSNESAPGDE